MLKCAAAMVGCAY